MPVGTDLLDELLASGVLLATGVDGVHGRAGVFEDVVDGLDRLVARLGRGLGAERMRFPPVMPRRTLERSGYLNGFPHLAGTVHCFCGDDAGHAELLRCVAAGEDWTAGQAASDLVLTPAACYPVYPMLALRGPLGAGGHLVDVTSYCFRREPSLDPARMQAFRMREYVRAGTPEQVGAFRDEWVERGLAVADALGLPAVLDVANDPFFGRGGRMMARSQREQALKFELLVAINDPGKPTACMSFNHHGDHFGEIWGIRTAAGAVAHTACVGFGYERLALALMRHHGFDPAAWPEAVRQTLGLAA